MLCNSHLWCRKSRHVTLRWTLTGGAKWASQWSIPQQHQGTTIILNIAHQQSPNDQVNSTHLIISAFDASRYQHLLGTINRFQNIICRKLKVYWGKVNLLNESVKYQITVQTSNTSGWRLTSSDSSYLICKVPVPSPVTDRNDIT